MKILVINLLRLGDLIMTTPALTGLKQKHDPCQLHLLINQSFANIEPLLPFVDRFWHFDRERLQNGLSDSDASLLEPFYRLKTLVTEINAENFDLVINLTHNRLSGYLMSALVSTKKWGLVIDSKEHAIHGSPWFRYLNNEFAIPSSSPFHYTDILYWACQLPDSHRRLTLTETEQGKREAFDLIQDSKPYVVIQPFSNEEKKNWRGLSVALRNFGHDHPEHSVYLLGSPQEQEKLLGLIHALKQEEHSAIFYPAICSLEGALSLIKQARLILTMDTSIKHLAATTNVPILEISLGSSNYNQTGSYSPNAVILQSLMNCAPCPHSKPCPFDTFQCGELFDPNEVAKIMGLMIHQTDRKLISISPQSPIRILSTHLPSAQGGFWYALPQPDHHPADTLGELIRKSARSFYLNSKPIMKKSPHSHFQLWQFGSLNHALGLLPQILENPRNLGLSIRSYRILLTGLHQALKRLNEERSPNSTPLRNIIDFLVSLWESHHLELYSQRFRSWIDFRLDQGRESIEKLRDLLLQITHEIEIEARLSAALSGDPIDDSNFNYPPQHLL